MLTRILAAAVALLWAGQALADPPPAAAPPYRASSGALIPTAVYDAAGNVVNTFAGAVPLAGTNRSATVAITAGVLMAANTARRGWKIKNDCANSVWINFDATAAAAAGSGNIKVAAGGYLASEPGFVETGAMSAIAETATCALTAREY